MHIRPLVPADAAAFKALRLRGLLECPSAFASSFEEEQGDTLNAIAQRLAQQPESTVFGAFDDSQLVGLLGLVRENQRKLAHKGFVWGVYVAGEARGKGVAGELLGQALVYAKLTLDLRQVNLGVNVSNLAAIALYRRHGFKTFGTERGFMLLEGQPHDELHMACVLA